MPTLPLILSLLPRAQTLPEASQLLDRREWTLGSNEDRSAVHGLEIRGRIEMADSDVACNFEELHLPLPEGERVLQTAHWGGWGATTQGTDGRATWSTDPAFGILVKEGAAGGAPRRIYAVSRSAPWRTIYSSARVLGVVERDQRKVYELEMQPKEGASDRWYLTQDTNELVRVRVVYPGPAGEEIPMEFVFGDWKEVEGVLYPHRRVQEILGSAAIEASAGAARAPMLAIVYRCTSIQPKELALADLVPPPDVTEALRDPSKRRQAAPADLRACKLETLTAQPTASIRLEIDATQVSAMLAALFPEIGRVVSEQKIEMTGPPYSRYHVIDTARGKIDFEAGIPVKTPIEARGRVKPSELPAGRTGTTWHVGSYHQLQEGYDRLAAWTKSEKLVARGGFWEIYWTDPGLEPDPSTWRTQILWPVE
jgi:effector-binding domain-containing protein